MAGKCKNAHFRRNSKSLDFFATINGGKQIKTTSSVVSVKGVRTCPLKFVTPLLVNIEPNP